LTADAGALAAPTESRLAVVRLAAKGRPELLEAPKAARADMPAPDSLEGMALDAAHVVLGTIQEVSLPDPKSQSAGSSVVLAFRAERSFKGDCQPGVVHVYVPAVQAEAVGGALKPLAPKVGEAALFFLREKKGGAYRLISPYRGYVPGEAGALAPKLGAAAAAEKRLRDLGMIGNIGGHDSVRDTIKTWMDAWNTKTEIEALVACYSRRSAWRQKWESGPEARLALAKTMATYPGTINVLCDRVDEKDKTTAAAAVRIQVIVTDPASRTDATEVRSVEMTFVHENSQWLILDEGN